MKIISVRNIDNFAELTRPKPSKQYKKVVESILSDVKNRGDLAIKQYERRFTGAKLTSLRVTTKEIRAAYSKVSNQEIEAIKLAKHRLTKTESALKKLLKQIILNKDGIKIKKSFSAIPSVGCYVPGGLARYPTTLVMSVVPAKIAGVKRIVVVSPPNKQGMIDPLTLVAGDMCEVNEFYKTGGAQAIGALTYGTKSIQRVDKIVGPGGPFVTLAKAAVSDTTSIDMVAGPTELCIIADDSANLDYVASDLFSQAEHSVDTFCYVITTSSKFATKLNKKIAEKIQYTKGKKIIQKSLKKNGFIAICKKESDVIKLANNLAPEHLEIITKKPQKIAPKIKTAGLVLVGKNTPSAASDYLLGSNHILPTNGFGKVRGSLSVLDFTKLSTEIESSKQSLQSISKFMKSLSKVENLSNHYESVRERL
jgi:histidinol dehydrogenase